LNFQAADMPNDQAGPQDATPPPPAPRVFISYSHDSPEHRSRVLRLANRLRGDGVDAMLDQYVQSPPEGWPVWCEHEIRTSDFVLMVCTETYAQRVDRGEQAGKGHGVLWEARLIKQHLYDTGSSTAKFVPVLVAGGSHEHVPVPVRGATIYNLETPDGYEDLCRLLTSQPLTAMPPLGPRKVFPPQPSDVTDIATLLPVDDPPSDDDAFLRRQLLLQSSSDLVPGALVSVIDERTGNDQVVRLAGDAHVWVKISPQMTSRQWDATDLRDMVQRHLSNLVPLYAPAGGLSFGRNQHGVAVWTVTPNDPTTTTSAVQLYLNGELWATDALMLSFPLQDGVKRIPMLDLEWALEKALPGYVAFLSEHLKIPLPLSAFVGVSRVDNFRLAAPSLAPNDLSARILGPGVFDTFAIDKTCLEVALTSPEKLLLPFIRKIWKTAGRAPPV
jgi:SEFIR domain